MYTAIGDWMDGNGIKFNTYGEMMNWFYTLEKNNPSIRFETQYESFGKITFLYIIRV